MALKAYGTFIYMLYMPKFYKFYEILPLVSNDRQGDMSSLWNKSVLGVIARISLVEAV